MSNPTPVVNMSDTLAQFLARANQFGETNQDLVQQKFNKKQADGATAPIFAALESRSRSVAQWPNMVDDFILQFFTQGVACGWKTVLDLDLTAETSVDIRAGGDGNYVLDSGETISVENSASSDAFDIVNGSGIVITSSFNGTVFNSIRTAALFRLAFSEFNFVPHVPTKIMIEYQHSGADTALEGFLTVVEHSNGTGVNNFYIFDQSNGAADRTLTWGRTTANSSTNTINTRLANADLGFDRSRGSMLTMDAAFADFRASFTEQAALPAIDDTDWKSIGVGATAASINTSFDNDTSGIVVGARSIAGNAVTVTCSRIRVQAIQ